MTIAVASLVHRRRLERGEPRLLYTDDYINLSATGVAHDNIDPSVALG